MSWVKECLGSAECVINVDKLPTKERPRFSFHGTYTPKKTTDAEKAIRREWRRQVGSKWVSHDGEVNVAIYVERPLAKSNPKYWVGQADTMKPDVDNIAKLVCDALNGLAYVDDKQITTLTVMRHPRPKYGGKCSIFVRVSYFTEQYIRGRDEADEDGGNQ